MAQSHPVRAHALALLAPCPLRLTSALSPRRSDDLPVALFDEPALVRVPRTAHVLPAAPLAYTTLARAHTASPARTSLARLRTGPSSKPSSAPPPGRCVSAILKPRRPPSPRPRSDAALPDAAGLLRRAPSSPSRGTRPARGPRPPVRSHHRPDTPSFGAFSLMRVPSTPRGFLAYSTALLYYILCL